jgi:hypothetical protein
MRRFADVFRIEIPNVRRFRIQPAKDAFLEIRRSRAPDLLWAHRQIRRKKGFAFF